MTSSPPVQRSFPDLGVPLFDATFVTLDIETTGGSPGNDCITEIGAVRSRGGEVTGTFQTLVRPAEPIPAFIELLTGISDVLVASAPPIEEVLSNLWEFLNGTVLVAHNASFDSSFLASAFKRYGYSVPFQRSVCTLRMARWLMRGETRDLKLETLAGSLGVATKPCHRAFPDARATFEIFHRLLELAGPLGVLTCEDLFAFTRVGRRPDTAKAKLAAKIPKATGVYKFLDARGKVIYVGKAKDLRARVRSYFYGDERPKTRDLVKEVARIDFELIDTEIESEIREQRLIRQLQPKYNRRGRSRPGQAWIKATSESIPRLVVARTPDSKTVPVLGPFSSQSSARLVLDAIITATSLPRCSQPKNHPQGCAFGEMGQCLAPCQPKNASAHCEEIDQVVGDIATGAGKIFVELEKRMESYSTAQRYEDAATTRDRMALVRARIEREEIVRSLREAGELTVCIPLAEGFEITVIEAGRFVRSEIGPSPLPTSEPLPIEASGDTKPWAPWVGIEEMDEALLLWSYLRRAARMGGWISNCSGVLALRVHVIPGRHREAS